MTTHITSTHLPDAEGKALGVSLFGIRFYQWESFVIEVAGGLSEDFDEEGAFTFSSLSNTGFLIMPAKPATFHVIAASGFDDLLSAEAFGVVACLEAYALCTYTPDPAFSAACGNQYRLLLDFSNQHREREAISALRV